MAYKLDIFKDSRGDFRWRRIENNGKVVETSRDSFKSKRECNASINTIGWNASQSISRVEGMVLTKSMAGQFMMFDKADVTPNARRAALSNSYGKPKGATK